MSSDITSYNTVENCFELHLYGERAFIECKLKGDVIYMIHTEVPETLRGHKVAQILVKDALDISRGNQWKVVPLCPYVRAFIQRHVEYQDLLREKDKEKYLTVT